MKRREIAAKFDEIVAFSEVEQFLDTPVKRYSSGMYVRLAFAVAAHLEPDVLIVDEVLAVGDAAFQAKCMGKMKDVSNNGKTVIVVSHNSAAISSICDSCVLLERGELVRIGGTKEVLSAFLSAALTTSVGEFDMSSHPARSRIHQSLIRKLTLRDDKNKSTSKFYSNSAIVFDLHLQLPITINGARLALAIEDETGRRIFTVANYFTKNQPANLAGQVIASCRIPKLRLGTGRYLLSASISTKQDGLLDSVDNAAWFDVEAHNCYEAGEEYLNIYGPILEESSWRQI